MPSSRRQLSKQTESCLWRLFLLPRQLNIRRYERTSGNENYEQAVKYPLIIRNLLDEIKTLAIISNIVSNGRTRSIMATEAETLEYLNQLKLCWPRSFFGKLDKSQMGLGFVLRPPTRDYQKNALCICLKCPFQLDQC